MKWRRALAVIAMMSAVVVSAGGCALTSHGDHLPNVSQSGKVKSPSAFGLYPEGCDYDTGFCFVIPCDLCTVPIPELIGGYLILTASGGGGGGTVPTGPSTATIARNNKIAQAAIDHNGQSDRDFMPKGVKCNEGCVFTVNHLVSQATGGQSAFCGTLGTGNTDVLKHCTNFFQLGSPSDHSGRFHHRGLARFQECPYRYLPYRRLHDDEFKLFETLHVYVHEF